MQNIFALLIPIKEEEKYLLLNVKDALNCCNIDYINNESFYENGCIFLPSTVCYCSNHYESPDCLIYLTYKLGLKEYNPVGYRYISTRERTDNSKYTFHTVLVNPVSNIELQKCSYKYCTKSLFDKDCYFGPEVEWSLRTSLLKPISPSTLSTKNYHWLTFEVLITQFKKSSIGNTLFHDDSTDIQSSIYDAFIEYSFPSCKMGYTQFYHFMKKQKVDDEEIPIIFRCFNTGEDRYIEFHHFLIGVACMDANTLHGGQSGELRSRYIFRYYDRDQDGLLDRCDIKRMVTDIHRKKQNSITDSDIKNHVLEAERTFDLSSDSTGAKVTEQTFLTVVGNLQFRGTSALFRFAPAVSFSSNRGERNDQQQQQHILLKQNTHDDMSVTRKVSSNDKLMINKCCSYHLGNINYELAVHSVKLRQQGLAINARPIWKDISDPQQIGELGNDSHITYSRLQSITTFNQDSFPNEILGALSYFRSESLPDKASFSWSDVNMEHMGHYIIMLCEDVESLLIKEPRMLEISSPSYVLGDIHGNYADLIEFERAFWRLGMGLSPSNFLFLGDYVDRGCYGLEVVMYLFAQKLLNPDQMFMLRGNHEVRSIQKNYTFYRECVTKFGCVMGDLVWQHINDVFDCLPVAAVIDTKLFCVHGGIPRPSLLLSTTATNTTSNNNDIDSSISGGGGHKAATNTEQQQHINKFHILKEAINSIPCPLYDPENESDVAWEIMWSDPFRNSSLVGSSNINCEDVLDGRAEQMIQTDNNFGDYIVDPFGDTTDECTTAAATTSTTTSTNSQKQQLQQQQLVVKDRGGDNDVFTDDGFTFNTQRQTACFFSASALDTFLTRFGFSHVIRAHEVHNIGFSIEYQAKLITVFSSSHYCKRTNEAACLLVNNRKLRLIRLDTST